MGIARVAALLCGFSGIGVLGQTASGLPVLTAIKQIRTLAHDEANRGYPVHLKAVVTYDDPRTDLFVQDSTGGIWVNAPPTRARSEPGTLLEIEGRTEAPDFAPQVGHP